MYSLTVGRTAILGELDTFAPHTDLIYKVKRCIMRTCTIKDCENRHEAKGYCNNHYIRFKKYGDPFFTKVEMHGMANTSEYKTWRSMKERCYNKNSHKYHRYGNRGITVCDRWRNSFIAFFRDMGLKPFPKAQIDRINNDGNYEPGNCRWATCAENSQNGSRTKLTMQKAEKTRELYIIGGILQRELGLIYGIRQQTISRIVNNKTWREINNE